MNTRLSIKHVLRATAYAAALFVTITVAQNAASAQDEPSPDAIYQAFGETAGLAALVDDLMVRLLADPRMNPFFKDIDQPLFKARLVKQLCDVSGGPCKTENTDMKKTHSGMDINASNFNALVEVLQQSMDARGIAFSDQSRLLAKLAPMHRDIVNVH